MSSPSSNKYKDSWEKDMGIHIPDDIWEESLDYIHSCSNNTRHCLIQFKIIHRLHFLKVKTTFSRTLHQAVINVSPSMQHFFMPFFLALKLLPIGLMYLMYCQEFLRQHWHQNHCWLSLAHHSYIENWLQHSSGSFLTLLLLQKNYFWCHGKDQRYPLTKCGFGICPILYTWKKFDICWTIISQVFIISGNPS